MTLKPLRDRAKQHLAGPFRVLCVVVLGPIHGYTKGPGSNTFAFVTGLPWPWENVVAHPSTPPPREA